MAARQTWQELALLAAVLLAGCKIPAINLATDEPIKVDIDMRLDVYQHNDGEPAAESEAPAATTASGDPAERRKDRSAEIQTFKNSRLVGERHDGLLAVLDEPPGEYGDHIRQTVARENTDRMAEMTAAANEQRVSLDEVQKAHGKLWENRSFSGEWIEVSQPDGSYKWKQKEG